jgi:hypothetical protein
MAHYSATTLSPKQLVSTTDKYKREGANTDVSRRSYADDQCRLYRNYLNNGTGLYQHIVLGASGQDYGYWSTGNGWVAWGMLRVLGTMMHSEYRSAMDQQKQDLQDWIVEILQASYPHTNVSRLRS